MIGKQHILYPWEHETQECFPSNVRWSGVRVNHDTPLVNTVLNSKILNIFLKFPNEYGQTIVRLGTNLRRQKQANFCEFEASLAYIVSLRLTRGYILSQKRERGREIERKREKES